MFLFRTKAVTGQSLGQSLGRVTPPAAQAMMQAFEITDDEILKSGQAGLPKGSLFEVRCLGHRGLGNIVLPMFFLLVYCILFDRP